MEGSFVGWMAGVSSSSPVRPPEANDLAIFLELGGVAIEVLLAVGVQRQLLKFCSVMLRSTEARSDLCRQNLLSFRPSRHCYFHRRSR